METHNILFETVIGSHIWKMDNPESDVDIFRCYIADTRDMLLGDKPKNYFNANDGTDIQLSEIGNVINGLIKNNFNYMIAVNSPIVRFDSGVLAELRRLSLDNISKECYNSIHGLAEQNYKKYIESGIDTSVKRCNQIARTLRFGITLLNSGKMVFEPFSVKSPDDIKQLMRDLDLARNRSTLPEKPKHVKELEDYLVELRIKNIHM